MTESSTTVGHLLKTDFDNPAGNTNTLAGDGSSPTMLTAEGTTDNGDSGGPLLLWDGDEWLIAGVLSGGNTPDSIYGDISTWTGVHHWRSEIIANGGEFVAFFVTAAEPELVAMFALSLLGFGVYRRRAFVASR
jgi:hypothetical protein